MRSVDGDADNVPMNSGGSTTCTVTASAALVARPSDTVSVNT